MLWLHTDRSTKMDMKKFWGCFAVILLAFIRLSSSVNQVKVGALYGQNTHVHDVYKNILSDAAQHINNQDNRVEYDDTDMSVINFQSATESGWYKESVSVGIRASCSFINNKDAHALIIPDDVCLDCQGMGSLMGNAFSPCMATDQASGSDAIKMYPIIEDMVELVAGVIKHYRWSTFILLYDQDSAYVMVEELLALAAETGWVMTPMVLAEDVKEQMKDIKTRRVRNIVVYMHVEENIKTVVTEAYEGGLLYDTWHWLFGNPNVAYLGKTFLETKLRYNSAFLTRFKMEVAASVEGNYYTRRPDAIRKWPFRQQLTYDSLLSVAHAAADHHRTTGQSPSSQRCGSGKSNLMPSFSRINFEGCSGEVAFNSDGERVNYTITIYIGKNQYHTTSKLGYFTQSIRHWEQKKGQRWPGKDGSRLYMKPFRMAEADHIHILSIEDPPFLMRSDYELLRTRRYRRQTISAGETYIGYVPELLQAIKKVFEEDMGIDFTYELELLGEGNYGRFDHSTQEWDGMMRDLYDGDADIIAGALTKTNIREKWIDFTSVWYKNDVQLLVKHPTYIWEYPFVPVFPYNIYAWLTNFLAYCVAVVFMWLVSYFNQNEWRAKASRGEVTEEVGDTFSFYNTAFYMLSIMAFQRYSKAPNSVAGRFMTAFWFVYTLMILWLYVSNLSPFLKSSKLPYKIRNLYDLNKQEQFETGVVRNSPTFDLFHQSTKGAKRITWDDIQTGDEDKIVQDLIDGVRKIRRDNGRYALLSEKKMLEYEALRWPCDLLITGGYVTKIKFPLAVQSGSPLRDQLTYAIKKLKKNGVLANITSRSYYKPYCKDIYKREWHKETKKSITSQDLAGMYYLMLLGFAATVILFTVETVYFYLKANRLPKIPLPRRGSRRNSDRGGGSSGFGVVKMRETSNAGGGGGQKDWI